METSDSDHRDFWTRRYAEGKLPWDLGAVPAALKSFLARCSRSRAVLIPGCGSGYEVQAFHAAGHDVVGIDFSPGAIEQAKKVLSGLAHRVTLGDFFTHDFGRRFDIVYERTFLCSMRPPRWPEYARRTADLLVPGGSLIGIFLYGQASASGPPFPMTELNAGELFKREFQLVRSDFLTDSLPLFRGMERWQEWQKKDLVTILPSAK